MSKKAITPKRPDVAVNFKINGDVDYEIDKIIFAAQSVGGEIRKKDLLPTLMEYGVKHYKQLNKK